MQAILLSLAQILKGTDEYIIKNETASHILAIHFCGDLVMFVVIFVISAMPQLFSYYYLTFQWSMLHNNRDKIIFCVTFLATGKENDSKSANASPSQQPQKPGKG